MKGKSNFSPIPICDRSDLDVLISIQSNWVWAIVKAIKKYEVRKDRPKLKPPFKCLIYCTKGLYCNNLSLIKANSNKLRSDLKIPNDVVALFLNQNSVQIDIETDPIMNGMVVGEFICDRILEIPMLENEYGTYDISDDDLELTCLKQRDLWDYGNGQTLYGWHISDLIVYQHPRPLQSLLKPCQGAMQNCMDCQHSQPLVVANGGSLTGVPKSSCNTICTNRIKIAPQSWGYVQKQEAIA